MFGWLTQCHVLIMSTRARRSCSTAVAPCLTGRHCGAIVIWNILYRACGRDTRLLIAQTPSLFCVSPLPSLSIEKGTAVVIESVYLVASVGSFMLD